MKQRLYLDYNATTPVLPEVLKTFTSTAKLYGNPSSLHTSGRKAKEVLENSRDTIARYIGADPEKLLFTGSGSEGNNQVLKSILYKYLESKEPAHVLVSAIEHSSIKQTAEQLKMFGVEVDIIPVDASGFIRIEEVASLLKPHTKLVSVLLANNEVGTLQSIKRLTEIVKTLSSALVHTDAVQAIGKIDVDVHDLGVDFLSMSSHKVYAPKGVGALYVKNDKTLFPLIAGSSHERKLRAGTENVPGIAAFSKALTLLDPTFFYNHVTPLIHYLREKLNDFPGVVIHTPETHTLNTTISIAFKGIDGQALAMNLDLEGIDVSTGAACSAGSVEPSSILSAMGISDELNLSTIRVSIGTSTKKEELDFFIDTLTKILSRLN
jgi:cysteine desulfurase